MFLSSICLFLIFLFVFNIKLTFFPYYSNLVISVFGFLIVLFLGLSATKFRIKKDILILLFLMLCIPCSFAISFIFNSESGDYYYLKTFFLNNVVYFFSAIFIFAFFLKNKTESYENYIKYLAIVVSLQLIVSAISFLNSSFFDFIFRFIAMEKDSATLENMSEYRLVGVGASFFGSGVINTITLLLIANSIMKKNNKNSLILMMAFFIIGFIGILSSRTTIVGLILSLLIFLINFKNNFKFIGSVFIAITSIFIVYPVLSVYNDKISIILDFGLSFLFDFKNSEAANSVGALQELYKIVPDNFKTWLIGDARFGDQISYYKGTDVGFYRIIFCTGILGLFFFFLLQAYILFKIKEDYLRKTSKIIILIALAILNLKGVASFFVVLILPYLLSVESKVKNDGNL
jgi:hypothetical protein